MPTYDYNIEGDIALIFEAEIGHGELEVVDRDLKRDPGLRTAIMVSLFSNCRADEIDALPDTLGTREGWWADELREDDDKIGSKLWFLGRGKMILSELVPLAEQYSREALQWMIDDGVASELNITASFYDETSLQIDIEIIRPEIEKPEFFTYYYNWNEEIVRSA